MYWSADLVILVNKDIKPDIITNRKNTWHYDFSVSLLLKPTVTTYEREKWHVVYTNLSVIGENVNLDKILYHFGKFL